LGQYIVLTRNPAVRNGLYHPFLLESVLDDGILIRWQRTALKQVRLIVNDSIVCSTEANHGIIISDCLTDPRNASLCEIEKTLGIISSQKGQRYPPTVGSRYSRE
jgi:hypothetical protein